MKYTLLKNLLNLNLIPNRIKKYLLILNICLFMSIFALISSSISIYYQQLISKINQQKIEIKTNKNLTNSIIFSVNKYEDLFNTILAAFRYDKNFADLIADNTVYENSPSRSRERFFINVKNFLMSKDGLEEDIDSFAIIIKDLRHLEENKILAKEDLDKILDLQISLKKRINNIYLSAKNDLIFYSKDFVEIDEDIKKTKKVIYFAEAKETISVTQKEKSTFLVRTSNIDYNRYLELSRATENWLQDYQISLLYINKILIDLHAFLDATETEFAKNISTLSNQSSTAIVFAFILQLVVFMFINFFEISTHKKGTL